MVETEVLVEPFVRLRTIDPSFDEISTTSSSPSLRLTVTVADQIARRRRRNRQRLRVVRLLLVRRQVAAVVGGPLLVAERLEPFLQIAFERLVEFVGLHLERFFVRVLAAADDALPKREQELSDAFHAELGLDELVDGVAQVVDQPRVAAVAVPLELWLILGTMSATAASRIIIRSSGSHWPRSKSAPPSFTHSGTFWRISPCGMMSN